MLENVRLQSCEGLALPFLLNWLFGDLTNLLGCILTDQLPFQTYIAAYFCFVDIMLTAQFFYYRRKAVLLARKLRGLSPHPTKKLRLRSEHRTPRTMSASLHSELTSSPKEEARIMLARSGHVDGRGGVPEHLTVPVGSYEEYEGVPASASTARPYTRRSRTSSSHLVDGSIAALSEAAMDAARAAERVQYREQSRRRRDESRTSGRLYWSSTSRKGKRRRTEDEDEVAAGMADSFYSEASGSSATPTTEGMRTAEQSPIIGMSSRGRLPRRPDLEEIDDRSEAEESGFTTRLHPIDGLPLPHSHNNATTVEERAAQAEIERQRRRSKSRSQSQSVARHRAAGVLFMGVWAFCGWDAVGRRQDGLWKRTAREGMVMTPPPVKGTVATVSGVEPSVIDWVAGLSTSTSASTAGDRHPRTFQHGYEPDSIYTWVRHHEPRHREPRRRTRQEIQRLIGRISAWTCTTLYLTSRLPQIWKNYMRKSCEGLSVLLFVFAFCGNLTYVIGILINPAGNGNPKQAAHYLLESLPYLLGSGGTLIFDLAIMIQSYLYRNSPPVGEEETIVDPHTHRHRSLSRPRSRKHVNGPEEEPLISQSSMSTDSAVLSSMRYTMDRPPESA